MVKVATQLILQDHTSIRGELRGLANGGATIQLERTSDRNLVGEKGVQLLLFGESIGGEHKSMGSIVRGNGRVVLFVYESLVQFSALLKQGGASYSIGGKTSASSHRKKRW